MDSFLDAKARSCPHHAMEDFVCWMIQHTHISACQREVSQLAACHRDVYVPAVLKVASCTDPSGRVPQKQSRQKKPKKVAQGKGTGGLLENRPGNRVSCFSPSSRVGQAL